MRYYSIYIPGAPSQFRQITDGANPCHWTSHPYGVWDPGAQQVELHLEELNASVPTENSTVMIYGVGWDQINQTANLNGLPIIIYGGMKPGLPIANYQAQHAGLLIHGRIMRAWGNWVGTQMSIGLQLAIAGNTSASDSGSPSSPGGPSASGNGSPSAQMARTGQPSLPVRYLRTGGRSLDRRNYPRGVMMPVRSSAPGNTSIPATNSPGTISGPTTGGAPYGTGTGFNFGAATSQIGGVISSLFAGGSDGLSAPINLIHNMLPNMPLAAAIQQTLSTAFPAAKLNVAISSIMLAYQDAGVYQNIAQYAEYIKKLSLNLLGGGSSGYPGVNISSNGNTMNVWDGTTPISEGNVSILDLIGQPTWIGPQKIHVTTVMRSDLHIGGTLTLPATLMGVSADAVLPFIPGSTQRTNDSFSGSFLIYQVLHIGDFRNPDGLGWSSNYEAYIYGQGASIPSSPGVPASPLG